ncbi:MAG: alpha/beta fold hydrolase [Bdellovibrionota bacterium]
MSTIKVKDGTQIFFKDWGSGQPIVFSHGWPLSADAWDAQMLFFIRNGYRVIAHDRRGHGRSTQTWGRNTMDQSADDLNELMTHLDLMGAILVGHSTGGGEVTRYIGRHGTKRVAKAVLVSAVPPTLLRTKTNPDGIPLEIFEEIRKGISDNRSQYFKDFSMPFYGYNREGAKVSEGIRDFLWLQSMMCGANAEYDYVEQFSETDFTQDLKKFDIPTLIIHGDDDQIVPIGISGLRTSKIVRDSELKIYQGAPHGLTQTHQDRFNADLLAFIRAKASKRQEAA